MVRRRKVGRTNYLALDREPLRRLQAWTDRFHPWWGTETESLETYAEYLSKDRGDALGVTDEKEKPS